MKQGWLIVEAWLLASALVISGSSAPAEEPAATKEFEIRDNRPFLGGKPVDLWGLRCGNGLYSTAVTERLINALDTMTAHGINLVGVYIQGPNAGWPDPEIGFDGFRRDGRLKPELAGRLEWLIREADARGMVVQVGLISPRKDQTFYDEDCIRRAIQETGKFLTDRKLKNVFVDLVHEYDHPERIDHEILREPDAAAKKARLTKWFKEAAPDIEAGVCQNFPAESTDVYPGQEVRIIEKGAAIPSDGFVVNVEITRQDVFENDGVFLPAAVDKILATCQDYLDAPHAVMMFHSAYSQGVTNKSGTAPHPEPGGYGTGPNDRGVRFYFDWVRDHVGRYEYPNHVKDASSAGRPAPFKPLDAKTGGKRP
ncbi:hypothetical protein [Paludisphaera rhizosphaerae]|uniref:hypothetical protein n=1 Tax=Paludisphaera rhizosphaerae TaxID=2711216 RepID=UPI0013EB01C5|nr:hypothetical protein [Paludisphaera rhizosphaerae]